MGVLGAGCLWEIEHASGEGKVWDGDHRGGGGSSVDTLTHAASSCSVTPPREETPPSKTGPRSVLSTSTYSDIGHTSCARHCGRERGGSESWLLGGGRVWVMHVRRRERERKREREKKGERETKGGREREKGREREGVVCP